MSVRAARDGFTLIEMIAVIAIMAILAAVLVTQIGGAQEAVEVKLARVLLQEIDLAASDYEVEVGDYPPSSFEAEIGPAPNNANLGAERLYVALWSDGHEGRGLAEDLLENSDGDSSSKPLTDVPTRELFEVTDPWGNPIAYFHHGDYGRVDVYYTFDPVTGEPRESEATARKSARLGRYHGHRRFQLLCAGPDGVFGTDDDVTNFEAD